MQGKGDRAGDLGYLFLKKKGGGAIRRDRCPALRLIPKLESALALETCSEDWQRSL